MKRFLSILIFVSLAGCQEKTDWHLQAEKNKVLAVDGMITNERKAHRVILSYAATELNGNPEPVSGAIVTLTDNNHVWYLKEDDSLKGSYYTDTSVIGLPGNTYTLYVAAGGKHYSASDVMPKPVLFNPLKYAESTNYPGLYQITWVASPYHPQSAALYEIQLDWSHVAGYENLSKNETTKKLYYVTLTTIDVSQLFSPEIEKILFPVGTVITERKYMLSSKYENFIRCLLLETCWRGGLFDILPANLPSNLSEGAVGFFSACAVSSVSLTVTPL